MWRSARNGVPRLSTSGLRLLAALSLVGSEVALGAAIVGTAVVAAPATTGASSTAPTVTTISSPVASPSAIGVNPVTDTVYVGSGRFAYTKMAVINGVTGSTTATLGVGTGYGVSDITVDPTLNKVWVLAGQVLLVTGVNNSLSQGPSIGTTPGYAALDTTTHTIYADNHNNYRYLSVITANTDALTTRIEMTTTWETLLSIGVDAKTDLVYAADRAGLTVYNGTTGALTRYTSVCHGQVAVDSTTNIVYVTCTTGSPGSIEAVNGTSLSVVATITVASRPSAIAVNPVTNTIFVTNRTSNSVSVINGSTDTVTTTISVGSHPQAVAVATTTNTVYVANETSTSLSVLRYPTSVPAAPQSVTAKATSTTSAYVRWNPPATSGGLPITGYTVASSPGGKTCTTTVATTCSITGLTRGTAYTFSVTATNSDGTGPAATSGSVAPAYAGASTISLTASCTTVTTDPVTDVVYVGCRDTSTGKAVVKVVTGETNSLTATVTAGGSGTARIVQVAVDNPLHRLFVAIKDGTYGYTNLLDVVTTLSNAVVATRTFTTHSANYTVTCSSGYYAIPTGIATDTATGKIVLGFNVHCGWQMVEMTPSTIAKTNYTTYGSTGQGNLVFDSYNDEIYHGTNYYGGGSIAIDTVTNVEYRTIGTHNKYGSRLYLKITNLTAGTSTTSSIPAGSHGLAVDESVDRVFLAHPSTTSTWTIRVSSGTSATVSATLTAGHTTRALAADPATDTVYAVNGWSGSSTSGSSTLQSFTAPGPRWVSATAGSAEAVVTWTSGSTGGAPITSYTVTSSPGGFGCTTTSTSCTITGLSDGTSYTFSVTATNIMGTGTPGISNAVTPSATPTITSLTPTSGPATGGTLVTITGANLTGASSVTFGGTAGTIRSDSSSQISAKAPAHAAGSVAVAVTTSHGSATAPVDFTYEKTPSLSATDTAANCNLEPVEGGPVTTCTVRLSVATDATDGYSVSAWATPLSSTQGAVFSAASLTGSLTLSPDAFGARAALSASGDGATLSAAYLTTRWVGYETSSPGKVVASSAHETGTTGRAYDVLTLTDGTKVDGAQAPGLYGATITYVVTPNY